MKKLYHKKPFILSVFAISVLFFCLIYQNTNNVISSTFSVLNSYISDSSVTAISNKLSEAFQSVQLQFSLRFLSGLVGVYINSIFLYLVIKIWNRFSKQKTSIDFYITTHAFYLSLYVSIFSYIILSLFMIITGSAMDNHQSIFPVLYNIWTFLLGSLVVVYYFKSQYGILRQTISYFFLYFVIILFINIGGYFEWITF